MITMDLQAPYFSGFYEGIWDQCENISNEIYAMQDLYEDFESLCFLDDWHFAENYYDDVANLFATEYTDLIKQNIYPNIKLVSSYIVSPREYNYSTDKIFAKIEIDNFDEFAKRIISLASDPEYRTKLGKIIKKNHSSRPGFMSFMSNDIEDWFGLLIDPNNDNYVWCIVGYLIDLMNPDLDLNEMMYEYVASETDWHTLIPTTTEAKEEWEIYLEYRELYIDWIKDNPRKFPDPFRPNWNKVIDWEVYKERFMEEVVEPLEQRQELIKTLKSLPVIPGLSDYTD